MTRSQRRAELGTFNIKLFWCPHPFPVCSANLTLAGAEGSTTERGPNNECTDNASPAGHSRNQYPDREAEYDQRLDASPWATFQSCPLQDLSLATEEIQRGIWKKIGEVLVSGLLGRYTGHNPFLVCTRWDLLVGALAILEERIGMGVEVFSNQSRAPERKGRMWSLRRSRPFYRCRP